MDYREKMNTYFDERPWIRKNEFAKLSGFDQSNFSKYLTGKIEVTEKTYQKFLEGIEKLKNSFLQ